MGMAEIPGLEATTGLAELGRHFEEISRLLGAEQELLPERVLALAAQVVPHAGHCGITLLREGRTYEVVSSSDPLAEQVDRLQHALGQGPCIDAAAEDDAVVTPDVGIDPRWPVFGPACVEQTGIHSILALRMLTGPDALASLNLYAPSRDAFDDLDLGVASIIAPFAAISVTTALHERDVANLGSALSTSRQIGTAVGILMASHGATSEAAFAMLRNASQHLNRKLRDVAEDVELTGELPASGTTG